MKPERKGPYRDPMHYTSRSGNLVAGGPGVHDSRQQQRAEFSFGVGGGAPPNNPRNADSHFIAMQEESLRPTENLYKDWRGVLPQVASGETQPIPARFAMTQMEPEGMTVQRLGGTPTTPLPVGLPPGVGPLGNTLSPGLPAMADPGLSLGPRARTGNRAMGMLPSVPGADMAIQELFSVTGGSLPPGAMPPKPPGFV